MTRKRDRNRKRASRTEKRKVESQGPKGDPIESQGPKGDPSRRDADLSALSLHDLMVLRDRIEAEIHDRRLEYERTLRSRGGMTERDGPRYRNPENSAETWSGHGRRPTWLEQALDGGATLEDLEIVDDRPVRSDDA